MKGAAQYFNPRSPHGERLRRVDEANRTGEISTHAPRTGSDWRIPIASAANSCISTHAPRTGSDGFYVVTYKSSSDFNPRSPHGERLRCFLCLEIGSRFQPTLPARGATKKCNQDAQDTSFQPTLPARGATAPMRVMALPVPIFQPTLPARGATETLLENAKKELAFQPTLPARGATRRHHESGWEIIIFQPTLPARGATDSTVCKSL